MPEKQSHRLSPNKYKDTLKTSFGVVVEREKKKSLAAKGTTVLTSNEEWEVK